MKVYRHVASVKPNSTKKQQKINETGVKILMQITKNNQENIGGGTQNIAVPPRSLQNKNAKIFSERYVKMRGQFYHLRVFYDGSCEFVRYDEQAKKWVFLCFPPDKIAE